MHGLKGLKSAALPVILGLLVGHASGAAELEVLRPEGSPAKVTTEMISVVGRTDPGVVTTATVGGVDVPVFRTGIFVRDHIPLQMGSNAIPVAVSMPDGTNRNERTLLVERVAPAPPPGPLPSSPLVIDEKSVEPASSVALRPGELLEVSFRGAPRNRAEFQFETLPWTAMEEVADPETGQATGLYRATITVPAMPSGVATDETSQPVTVRLSSKAASGGREDAGAPVLAQSKGRVAVWGDGAPVRLLRVSDPRGLLQYGLTEVRLGGPYIAELPQGTLLRAVGRSGANYRVELTPTFTGWIHASEVEPAPPGTPVPHLAATGMIFTSTPEGDVIQIPYTAPIPFAVSTNMSGPDGRPSLNIDLYGAHKAATWMTHRVSGELIEQVTAEQDSTDHLRVQARLNMDRFWGYKTEVTTAALRITIRRPPALAQPPAPPLSGLTISVNAGHGGQRDGGARGITRAREADVTLAIANLLADQLTSAGAKVIRTRPRDESVGLSERTRLAMEANADLFVSVHANSGGTKAGYLVTSGTSTYYKHAFNHELAEIVRRKVIERTGLANFGTVGNFNYSPIRLLTWMPAILVETAFISNPMEEAKLTDPAFQQVMATAVREGLEEYLDKARRPDS